MIRLFYNLLWPLGLLLFLPGYLLKMFRRGGYREKFGQRLGIYGPDLPTRLAVQQPLWLHAVSVGEVAIAFKLISAIQRLEPKTRFVLTITTTTGFAFARQRASPDIELMYAPLDFWPVMHRAFNVIKPRKIILVEAEVWPNLAAEAHARKLPLALVNARLSPRSERRFRRFRTFVAPTFALIDLVCVQEPEDIDRWSALGVSPGRIRHVGSIKYDQSDGEIDPTIPRSVLHEWNIDSERPILFGGSTHPGEEEILGKIFGDLRAHFPNLFLIVAPRHVERANNIRRTLEQLGLRVVLRSQPPETSLSPDCLVLDSTGELRNWYAVATAVFVGKSLAAHGGQNPVEAIAAGKPVVFGPNMQNFDVLARSLIAQNGALQVDSAVGLQSAMKDLLRDSALRERLVKNARTVFDAHRGATDRTAKLIADL